MTACCPYILFVEWYMILSNLYIAHEWISYIVASVILQMAIKELVMMLKVFNRSLVLIWLSDRLEHSNRSLIMVSECCVFLGSWYFSFLCISYFEIAEMFQFSECHFRLYGTVYRIIMSLLVSIRTLVKYSKVCIGDKEIILSQFRCTMMFRTLNWKQYVCHLRPV